MAENQPKQGRESSVSQETEAQQLEATQAASHGSETPSSANPDHNNTKVQRQAQGRESSVAATEEEKGGSSE
ncbi:MAG: hypothetical protein HC827_08670 [Cyanobacteria bacterium RM1_2_2]|nr:hypothetical protein [Cyanobacteria bacterium RM1_2_2]